MMFIDRYWEWRRRRALKAEERAHGLALVLEVLMERRGVTRRPEGRERASPAGQSDKYPLQWTEEDEQTGANSPGYSTILVAVDGSEGSRRVGEHAVYLAEKLGARLFILGVVNKHLAFRGGIY